MLDKEDLKYLKISSDCKKAAQESISSCYFPGCTKQSINSHILQKNGILSTIAPDRHLWQLEIDNFSEKQFKFRRRGLNEVFSFNCFCNEHDGKLFKKIERGEINFDNYESKLLFSLRTLYNEIFRKQVNVKHFEYLIKNLPEKFDNGSFKEHIRQEQLGIQDLKFTEKELWKDLNDNSESFVFNYRKLNKIEVCLSSIYNYETSKEVQLYKLKYGRDIDRLCDIAINLFPYQDNSVLLMGYHKEDEKKLKGYVNIFFKETEKRILRSITNLLMFQCETWVCSDSFYNEKIKDMEESFVKATKFSLKNNNERRNFDLNIFDNNFSQKLKIWEKEKHS